MLRYISISTRESPAAGAQNRQILFWQFLSWLNLKIRRDGSNEQVSPRNGFRSIFI